MVHTRVYSTTCTSCGQIVTVIEHRGRREVLHRCPYALWHSWRDVARTIAWGALSALIAAGGLYAWLVVHP